MTRDNLENRARELAKNRHILRGKQLACNSRFPIGTAVIAEAGGLTILFHGKPMLTVDIKGQVTSPLTDEGLRDLVQTLEGVLNPETAKA